MAVKLASVCTYRGVYVCYTDWWFCDASLVSQYKWLCYSYSYSYISKPPKSTFPNHKTDRLQEVPQFSQLYIFPFFHVIHNDRHAHAHTTRVSRYQKSKPIWILLELETVSGSGISWAICKSAPRSRQITMPAPHHSVFYRPDALPAAQPTASKHWRHISRSYHNIHIFFETDNWNYLSQLFNCMQDTEIDNSSK